MASGPAQKRRRRQGSAPPPRPLWVILPFLALASVAVSGIIAWASVHFFYAILLYSFLFALSAAVFAGLLFDRLAFAGPRALVAVSGAAWALGLYLLYWVLVWRFGLNTLPEALTLAEFIAFRAEGMTLGRYGRTFFGLAPWGAWLVWTAEAAIAAGAAAYMTPLMHEGFRET